MKVIILVSIFLLVMACGKQESAPSIPDLTVPASTALPINDDGLPVVNNDLPVTPPADSGTPGTTDPVTVQLTYYHFLKTIASATISGVPVVIKGTGNCIVVSSKTYCWDDGLKTNPALGGAFTYWGLDQTPMTCPNVHGGCDTDLMIVPIYMSTNVVALLNTVVGSAHRTVTEVLTSGTATQVTCNVGDDGKIDCGTFIIDTNQSPL